MCQAVAHSQYGITLAFEILYIQPTPTNTLVLRYIYSRHTGSRLGIHRSNHSPHFEDSCVVESPAVTLTSDPVVLVVDGSRPALVEDPGVVSARLVRLLMPVPVPVSPVGRLNEERPLVIDDKPLRDDRALPPVSELKPASPLLAIREDRESVFGRMPDVPLLGNRLVIEERAAVESPAVEPVRVEKSRPES